MSAEIDTVNDRMVSCRMDRILMLNPPYMGELMDRAAALRLAAWLVAMTFASDAEFAAVLDAVRNT